MGAAIPLVGGAILGGIQGEQDRKNVERQNKGRIEANRFADVTGNFQKLDTSTPGFFGGAIKGASTFAPLAASGFGGGKDGSEVFNKVAGNNPLGVAQNKFGQLPQNFGAGTFGKL